MQNTSTCEYVSRGDVYRDLPGGHAGRVRAAVAIPPVSRSRGGIPSHAAPETPGSLHEGGELGYSLSHAFGAVFDDPDFIVACVIGDGEAETGPLVTAWYSNALSQPD
jgi:hypothetical protein